MATLILWYISISFTGLGLAITALPPGWITACGSFIVSGLLAVSIGSASAIVTATTAGAANAVNKYGADIVISATKGMEFLGMSWGTTAAMLIACIVLIIQVCVG